MAEANAFSNGRPVSGGYDGHGSGAGAGGPGYPPSSGYAPSMVTSAGAAGLGAGAMYAHQQQSPPSGSSNVTRGPSSASAFSGSTGGSTGPNAATGSSASSVGASGITAAAAAKRAEAQRERNRLTAQGGGALDEEDEQQAQSRRGTFVHQDGGRMQEDLDEASEQQVELPPTYGSIPVRFSSPVSHAPLLSLPPRLCR